MSGKDFMGFMVFRKAMRRNEQEKSETNDDYDLDEFNFSLKEDAYGLEEDNLDF